jgi:hypothetical protein
LPDPGSNPGPGADPAGGGSSSSSSSGDPDAALCAQLGYAGQCSGTVLTWCESGRLRQVDCASRGSRCGWENDGVGNNCLAQSSGPAPAADACGGVDYLGYCTGDGTLVWCDGGVLRSYDCAADGLSCQYVDDTTGNTCVQAF